MGTEIQNVDNIDTAPENDKEGPLQDPKKMLLSNEKGDIVKQVRQIAEPKPKPAVIIPMTRSKQAAKKTKSKTELTYKEMITNECWQRHNEKLEELKRQEGSKDDNAEILDIPLPFRSVGQRSSLTNLHNLMEQCPQPQPPIINKQLKTLQLNADQAYIMAEQVQKMKTGMERLQAIIKKFNCTERFKKDIDFIIANVGPAIAKAEKMRHSHMEIPPRGCSADQSKRSLP